MHILLEDPWVLAVDKPSGLAVHRGWAKDDVTLVDLVREHTSQESAYPISRLDRGASGVVLFAKSPEIARVLQEVLGHTGQERNVPAVEKTYWVLVRGQPPVAGVVDHPVPQKEGGTEVPRVPAVTLFRTLATVQIQPRTVSWVEAKLVTGRLHQIRRHMKHLGHPVLGDANYGRGDLNREFARLFGLGRLALHARNLQFPHPHTGQPLSITAPLPDDLSTPMTAMGFELQETASR